MQVEPIPADIDQLAWRGQGSTVRVGHDGLVRGARGG
jgi:hypothetical protein